MEEKNRNGERESSISGLPAGPTPEPEPGKGRAGWVMILAAVLAVSLIVSAGSVFVYDYFYAPRIVAMDLKGYLARQRDLFVQGKITEEQFRENMDRFEDRLNRIPKNRVVLMGDAVLRGVTLVEP